MITDSKKEIAPSFRFKKRSESSFVGIVLLSTLPIQIKYHQVLNETTNSIIYALVISTTKLNWNKNRRNTFFCFAPFTLIHHIECVSQILQRNLLILSFPFKIISHVFNSTNLCKNNISQTFAFDLLPDIWKTTSPYALVSFLAKCWSGSHAISSTCSLSRLWVLSIFLSSEEMSLCSSLVRPQWHLQILGLKW